MKDRKRKDRITYLIADFISAFLAFLLLVYIAGDRIAANHPLKDTGGQIVLSLLVAGIWMLFYYLSESQRDIYRYSRLQVFAKTIVYSALGTLFILGLFSITQEYKSEFVNL